MTTAGGVKFVFITLLSFGWIRGNAQFTSIDIGINGLTCSQCSRSVEMELRKLGFLKSIQMDLEHTSAVLALKEDAYADIAAVARAVRDAGFSVRYLKARLKDSMFFAGSGNCRSLQGDAYFILNASEDHKRSDVVQFIGKDFMPKPMLKQYHVPPVAKTLCPGKRIYSIIVLKE